MARRTKEDALATRDSIIDAAEQLFVQQGVSRTTLQHIASAAGVTRGAIYWHFDDKAALFNAMMERAKMPIESAIQQLEQSVSDDPLHDLREYMVCVLMVTVNDPQARRVFEIATLKLEFTDELHAVRDRRKQTQGQWMARVESRIRRGVRQGQLRASVNPQVAALAMWATIDGLIRTWLFDPAAFDLVAVGTEIVDDYLDSLRAA
jgi:TetR/AcrR family transcriptional regulator, acrAB operon repressor